MGGCRGQPGPRALDRLGQAALKRPSSRGPPSGLPRSRRRPFRRPVPGGRLPDRLRHFQQHERQRGDCQPGHRAGRRRPLPGRQADPSQRPREPGPVDQRHLPHGDSRGRGHGDRPRPRARAGQGGRSPRAQGRGVEGRAQDRAHAPGRRHAARAWAGDRRAGAATGAFGRAGPAGDKRAPRASRRGHGRRHGPQHPSRVRPPRSRVSRAPDRHPVRRGRQPLRGQCPARRPGGMPRTVADHRGDALQRGQQRPLACFRAAVRVL